MCELIRKEYKQYEHGLHAVKVREDALQFLQTHKTAVLATVSPDGEPQAATVTYVIDDGFEFYFVTRRSSRKFENIVSNPTVAIVIGTNPYVPVTAQLQGIASIIEDENHFMFDYLVRTIDKDSNEWKALSRLPGVDYVLVKVKLTWLRWLNLDDEHYPETYREEFQYIINP